MEFKTKKEMIENFESEEIDNETAEAFVDILLEQEYYEAEWDGYYPTAKWDDMEDDIELWNLWELAMENTKPKDHKSHAAKLTLVSKPVMRNIKVVKVGKNDRMR